MDCSAVDMEGSEGSEGSEGREGRGTCEEKRERWDAAVRCGWGGGRGMPAVRTRRVAARGERQIIWAMGWVVGDGCFAIIFKWGGWIMVMG